MPPEQHFFSDRGTRKFVVHLEPASSPGAPTSGTYLSGDVYMDSEREIWRCLQGGTPGTWEKLVPSDLITASKLSPGQHFTGTLFDYPLAGSPTNRTIQYTRIWLQAGLKIDRMRVYQEGGGSPSRNIRLGIYNQTPGSEQDETLPPNALVAQTASSPTDSANNSSFVDYNLRNDTTPGSNGTMDQTYETTYTGYYWLAVIVDSTSLSFATTNTVRANFIPRRVEAYSGSVDTVLPALAGGHSGSSGLTNPVGGIGLIMAVDE